jgi:hypothetical protein
MRAQICGGAGLSVTEHKKRDVRSFDSDALELGTFIHCVWQVIDNRDGPIVIQYKNLCMIRNLVLKACLFAGSPFIRFAILMTTA